MVLNSMQRQIGKDNFEDASRVTRRQFLTGAVALPSAAALYWGYDKLRGDPVRVGVIGTGDQGKAHISSMNPEYCQVVAYSDIRPSNQRSARTLLNEKFPGTADRIRLYEDYRQLLADPAVEMVIIALPLHLHAEASIAAMEAGKHVLCEKLMAKTVMECKQMVRTADRTGRLLAIGHQRHYSYLYANALALVEQPDILGDIRHIRAFWHRNQTGGGAPGAETGLFDGWHRAIPPEDEKVDCRKYGYSSLEELVRWRLSAKTGGGLMVELGSHQLDAVSIFLGKVHPRSVQGVGTTSFFTDGREVNDHIFLTFEFPGKRKDGKETEIIVTYSSICTNTFDGYGEQVMGTRGTLVVLQERDAYLFREPALLDKRLTGEELERVITPADKDTRITWAETRMSRPTTTSGSTAQWATGTDVPDTLASRGYREEQEHMAWIIRNPDSGQKPRCDGRVALADAVVALTANLAMAKKKRIEFKPAWFDPASDSVPENEV